MKAICKQAGITIPPSIYKGKRDNRAIEDALETLLQKYNLDRKSSHAEIMAVQRRIQKEKDLEGVTIRMYATIISVRSLGCKPVLALYPFSC